MTIRAVIFDFGGVLMQLVDQEHVETWARRLAIDPTVLRQALWGEHWNALERGEIDDRQYHRQVGKMIDLPDSETIETFIDAFYADEQLIPEMLDLIERLRGRVRLGLLTNAFPGQADILRAKFDWDPEKVFDAYVNSSEEGVAKPDPQIYQLVLARLSSLEDTDILPHQAIFIDDLAANVQAAAELGLHAIQFTTPQAVIAGVERLVNA